MKGATLFCWCVLAAAVAWAQEEVPVRITLENRVGEPVLVRVHIYGQDLPSNRCSPWPIVLTAAGSLDCKGNPGTPVTYATLRVSSSSSPQSGESGEVQIPIKNNTGHCGVTRFGNTSQYYCGP